MIERIILFAGLTIPNYNIDKTIIQHYEDWDTLRYALKYELLINGTIYLDNNCKLGLKNSQVQEISNDTFTDLDLNSDREVTYLEAGTIYELSINLLKKGCEANIENKPKKIDNYIEPVQPPSSNPLKPFRKQIFYTQRLA